VAKGWGPGTRERQHASRDTIPERWGEKTHPRTQAQLSLNRSALAAAGLQLPTQGSGVHTSFTLDFSAAATSLEATASRLCQCCCPARYFPVLATASSGVCMYVCEWCSSALHLPVHVQGGSAAPRVRQRSQRDVHGVRLRITMHVTSCRHRRGANCMWRWGHARTCCRQASARDNGIRLWICPAQALESLGRQEASGT